MKTLKVKSILFSLLAIMTVSVFLTSCEQDTLTSTSDLDAITQLEKEQAQAEYDLIASYGEETLAAYEAYLGGETLSYYAPVGVTESVEFDWANYSEIMEHTKIITAAEKSGKMGVYNQNIASGTYLTMADVEKLTPELLPFIDNPDAITSEISNRCETVYGSWNNCGSCKTYVFFAWNKFIFIKQREQCRTVAPCNAPCYTQKRKVGC